MMKGDHVQTNKLHDINWGSIRPHLATKCHKTTVHTHMYTTHRVRGYTCTQIKGNLPDSDAESVRESSGVFPSKRACMDIDMIHGDYC